MRCRRRRLLGERPGAGWALHDGEQLLVDRLVLEESEYSWDSRVLEGADHVTCRPADLLEPELEHQIAELEKLAKEKGIRLADDVVDDVLTSGATLATCAEACLANGATDVRVLALARVVKEG